jgi:hypothetical protein
MRSLALALILMASAAAAAPASDGKELLWRGIALYREAAYAASVATLESARAKGGLEGPQRVECAFFLGAGYVALGSTAAARRELKTVLQEDPEYELPPYTSPKVAALFHDVRDELERAPRLRPLPPERRGDALTLRFEASRTGGRAFGVVEWRWRGERDWREAPLGHAGGELVASVPVEHTGALEYWADARAPAGGLQAGTADAPLELPIAVGPRQRGAALLPTGDEPQRRRSRGARLWWLWTSIGAVATAGLGVGLYYALRPQPASTADAVFGFQVR